MMIGTERLWLRPWTEADRAPFAAMSADPEVMRFLGPLQTRDQSDAAIDRAIARHDAYGFCFWAIERKHDGVFLGFCGLQQVTVDCPVTGAIELGWRLRRDAWGQNYAFEAARASRDHALIYLRQPGVVAFTVAANTRSQRVMTRIGLTRHPQYDFDHPALGAGDPLRPHIVFARGAE